MFTIIQNRKLTRNYTLDITPTVQELARSFSELDNNEQAEFFNEVGKIVRKEWDGLHSLNGQIFDVINKGGLNKDGRKLLEVIAEFISEESEVTR